jgi:acetyl-CoA C-acetyltransferase
MSVIAAYRRTPYGKFLGSLASTSAISLGAAAIRGALAEIELASSEIDLVVAGHVLQAGLGQNPARQTAIAAGIPLNVPSLTLNAVCLSGMEAVIFGHRLIEAGEASVVVCVGQESMSRAPHILQQSRIGKKYGALEAIDSLEFDGLTDSLEQLSMGALTDCGNKVRNLSRESQDLWAAQSHSRAAQSGKFHKEEIEPIEISVSREKLLFDRDEGIRAETTVEALSQLVPAFSVDGTITAGNSSQISDGAACIILMSESEASRRGINGMARILSHAFVAGPDNQLHSQPSAAISTALNSIGRRISECKAFEINEAFAAVVLQSISDLDIDPAIVNQHGGAIALGHPIGSSGARIVGSLARQVAQHGEGSIGAAGICGGGGQGSAIVLEALPRDQVGIKDH